MNTLVRSAIAAAAFAWLAPAALAQPAPDYYERTEGVPVGVAAYFTTYFPREQHRESVIIAFDATSPRADHVAAALITQTINCETGQINTEHYVTYGDDGAMLGESQNLPDDIAAIGAGEWQHALRARCNPPAPPPQIPAGFAIDPPPAYDRRFGGHIADGSEAVVLLRARVDARAQVQALTQDGRWGTFTGRRILGGAYIDYTEGRTDATHMAYLVVPGIYEQDWSYGRARYAVDCAARTAFAEYLVLYNDDNEVISVSGPSQRANFSALLARDALVSACASTRPRGRTYRTLQDALSHLRRETAEN